MNVYPQSRNYKFLWAFFAAVIFLISIGMRVINLNYNSPFNDEAIYIVIGKMGVFEWDWWSYNARTWMAGLPYIYPPLTALTYVTGGIVGSRFLSVVLGLMSVEAVYVISLLLTKNDGRQYLAGLVSASVLGGAGVSLYVSRLATLDVLSFAFFFLSLAVLIWAVKNKYPTGKWFFISSMFLLLSFLTKIITAIYIPMVVAYSFWEVRKDKVVYGFWKKYFFIPLALSLMVYTVFNLNSLRLYALSQSGREKFGAFDVIKEFWNNSVYVWVCWAIGSVGMFFAKERKKWLVLTLAGLWMLVFHITIQRIWWTLNKHTFMSVAFLAIVSGIGVSNIIWHFKPKAIKKLISTAVVVGIIVFWVFSYADSQRYNNLWNNADEMLATLPSVVNKGDKVLAEVGASAILALYDKNHPSNVTTYDWFEYQKLNGVPAYVEAVRDEYFNVIEVEGDDKPKDITYGTISDAVRENIEENYQLVYSKDSFYIYRRTY